MTFTLITLYFSGLSTGIIGTIITIRIIRERRQRNRLSDYNKKLSESTFYPHSLSQVRVRKAYFHQHGCDKPKLVRIEAGQIIFIDDQDENCHGK